MKRLLPLLFIGSPVLAGDIQNAGNPGETEIPLGLEVVTGYRSETVYRGFSLANSVIDVQLESQIALSDHWLLNLGAWYATSTGSENFSEAAGFLDLRYAAELWEAGLAATGRSYDHSFFQDGVDVGPYLAWVPSPDWRIGGSFSWDSGPSGWFGDLRAEWSKPIGESAFVSIIGGTSWLSDYYGRSGWNDLFARASFTYAINQHVAVTPFVGTSIPMSSSPGRNRLFGGIWFEVNF